MNDRELLLLAAKAVGIDGEYDSGVIWCRNEFGDDYGFNPLRDDGAALRLAVKLKIDINFFEGYEQVLASSHDLEHEVFIDYTDDREKDVRLAIVTVAAALAEDMP